jgi:hypothetical protein
MSSDTKCLVHKRAGTIRMDVPKANVRVLIASKAYTRHANTHISHCAVNISYTAAAAPSSQTRLPSIYTLPIISTTLVTYASGRARIDAGAPSCVRVGLGRLNPGWCCCVLPPNLATSVEIASPILRQISANIGAAATRRLRNLALIRALGDGGCVIH